ncbi:MAG: ATP-binding protein [Desulfuromonadales bacterium]
MEQLIHAQKMESIGELAGGLAHDLNNILSVVNGYVTLAQQGMDREQKQFSYLDEVIRASSRAASLTRSLLVYSRKQQMNQQQQNLNALITTVGSFIERIIHDNILFTLSLCDGPLVVNVDKVQIEQVLLNLATNARDAMADGGAFTIATAAGSMDTRFVASHGYGTVGRYAIITVTDSGHGMDEQTKQKVFNPFYTTKEVGKGTGLGLSMVMGIIKQHGGFIDLQSEPGTGSVFKLYLPLADAGEIEAEDITEQNTQTGKAKGTILVAEDDDDTRVAVEEFLTRAGYTVITAEDGQDAVDRFAARYNEIELVITDIVMPKKSGKAASEEMRAMSDSVKFIFVSGHASDIIEREGVLGADVEIITKPILPYELLRKIQELIPSSKKGSHS